MLDKIKNKKRLLYICVVVMALIGLIIYGVVRDRQQAETVLDLSEGSSSTEQHSEIVVHVAGEVNTPGVVTLKNGDRIADAIKAAGGLTANADADGINLAAKVEDGQKIMIRNVNETAGTGSSGSQNGLVNINTADKTTLMTLSGIGEVIADNIIKYRESNGGFSSIEEIKKVNRIGDKMFEQIKDQIII